MPASIPPKFSQVSMVFRSWRAETQKGSWASGRPRSCAKLVAKLVPILCHSWGICGRNSLSPIYFLPKTSKLQKPNKGKKQPVLILFLVFQAKPASISMDCIFFMFFGVPKLAWWAPVQGPFHASLHFHGFSWFSLSSHNSSRLARWSPITGPLQAPFPLIALLFVKFS